MQDRAEAIFYPKGQTNNQRAFIPILPEDTAKARRFKNKQKARNVSTYSGTSVPELLKNSPFWSEIQQLLNSTWQHRGLQLLRVPWVVMMSLLPETCCSV